MIYYKRNHLFYNPAQQVQHAYPLKNGMYAVAFSLLGDAQEAASVLNTTLTVIKHALIAQPSLRLSAQLKTFAYKTLVRECIQSQKFVSCAVSAPASSHAPQSAWDVINGMPPVFRTMTLMFYLENMRAAEIAKTLNLPVKNVKSAIAAARQQLKAFVF